MNIRVDLNTNIADGSEVVFRSPADCSQVTGLVIYHNGGKTEFAFADAHGNNVGDIDHLFAENAVVKVILDVTAGMAFVQNADTNAYIERTFVKTVNGQAPDENGNVKVTNPEGGNGADGYTPVRGEDYYTPEDVADIVSKASAEAKAAAVEEALSVMRAPTLLPQDTWYKGATARTAITEIRVLDSFTPSETDVEVERWPADIDGEGNIMCYVLTDAVAGSTVLIMAGNGSGRIMANADSKFLFSGANASKVYTAVECISGLEYIDTRNVTTLQAGFNLMSSLHTCTGHEHWNVSRCKKFRLLYNGNSKRTKLDLSAWDFSAAVEVADDGKNVLDNSVMGKMINNCHALRELKLNKSFDVRFAHLPVPRDYDGQDIKTEYLWLDADTLRTYTDDDDDAAVTANGTVLFASGDRADGTVGGDGVVNPAVVGRDVTLVAVLQEGEVDI